jgi:hypothetical protein
LLVQRAGGSQKCIWTKKQQEKQLKKGKMGNGEHLRSVPWSSRFFRGAVTIETPHDQLPQHVNEGKAAELGIAGSYYELGNRQK